MAKEKDKASEGAGAASAAPAASPAVEILKKVSTAKVMDGSTMMETSGTLKRPEKATDLYTVFGVANGFKTGNTDKGEWVACTGQIMAVRAEDGKHFASGTVFLPAPADRMLLAALQDARENDATASIRFAYVIGYKPAKNPYGYEYTVKPVIENRNDALADLRASLIGKVPALSHEG